MADNSQTPQIAPTSMPPEKPHKELQFEEFLKQIGNANLPQWNILAEALGVSQTTIIRWKNHPTAQAALSNAIEENMRKMTEVGANDWKMYRDKLKMLGVKEKSTIEHEAGESVSGILDQLQTDYAKLGEWAGEQLAKDRPPTTE